MQTDNGATVSAWMAGNPDRPKKPLENDISADVCVIGGGIAGVSTAYQLTKRGVSVVLIDDGPIGGGETCRTTAHLVSALDDRYFDIERIYGTGDSRISAESHTDAVTAIEQAVRGHDIDCDFFRVSGYLFLSHGQPESILDDELEAGKRALVKGIERVDRAPIKSFDTGPCVHFPNQGQFEPIKYLYGLCDVIEKNGGQIFNYTRALNIEGGKDAKVTTRGDHTISCNAIVVATNTPIHTRIAMHTKQAAYRTYVLGARIPKGSVPRILLWDTGDYVNEGSHAPYHYVRIQENWTNTHDLLIVGGEDHKTGQNDDAGVRFAKLEEWMRNRFPEIVDIAYKWSGQIMESVDDIAFIGRTPGGPDNVFLVTGDSGNGMTHGTIAGLLLPDLIAGRKHPWERLYDPSRKPLSKSFKEFAKENTNVARQYCDYVLPAEIRSPEEVSKGSGAVVRRGIERIALYRDDAGKVHEFSAVCRHLGCIVQWNSLEKSWDCPCHGARYGKDGHVINGPANEGLKRIG